jgi:sec-independent protein translocase protein TatA
MPDLGVPELLIIAVIVLLLFGPGKAADIGGSLGKSIR